MQCAEKTPLDLLAIIEVDLQRYFTVCKTQNANVNCVSL